MLPPWLPQFHPATRKFQGQTIFVSDPPLIPWVAPVDGLVATGAAQPEEAVFQWLTF